MRFFLFMLLCIAKLHGTESSRLQTETPIKHLVVIIPENASFDHIFGTYPHALNPPGEPHFKPKRDTPKINGLTEALRKHNTNLVAPFRLSRSQVATTEPAHHYTQLQQEAHGGLLDRFVQVNSGNPTAMAHFDGNTVTALWNYAQRFAMCDNCFSTTMTPSSPGHINIISGQTHGAIPPNLTLGSGEAVVVDGTLIGDPDPAFDKCSHGPTVELTGANVGNRLNAKKIPWGCFQGGFSDCSKTHIGSNGVAVADYSPHHNPFQYYQSTANPDHLPPSSIDKIGLQDQANHQYDIADFWKAVKHHRLPAVSFIKPPAYQDGHPNYSDQLALQRFLVKMINKLQQLPEWKSMAIVIPFDDSGGWYDHVMPPIINQSHVPPDALLAPGDAGSPPPGAYQGRLAYGMRIPLLLISPFARRNYVDSRLMDQTSVLRFIENNWHLEPIKDQSFDTISGPFLNLFDFDHPCYQQLLLHPKTGLQKP
ncbi:MAG: alkaline phosphatase family protein [Parachlamydia sp.]|nr:alkaline phosphatase family protein [Parachlamydia sp.]